MRTILLSLVLLTSCGSQISKDQLPKINGYWEIEKVVLSDGTEKAYEMNTTIDYFKLEDMLGYRKKVQPLLDGTFDTSDDAQAFEVSQNGEIYSLRYKNELSEWTETIVYLNETTLVLSNGEGVSYHYKKFEPINLDLK